MSEMHRWIGGISALFGAWVFASAFVFDMAAAHFWNALVVGAAVFVLAGYSAMQAGDTETATTWSSGLAAVLGLWTIASPFVYGAGTTAMWSSVISGIVVAVLSGYNTFEASGETSAATRGETGA